MAPIRFDGRVAIVTGAGRGLGRAYALELARRGASVVVNDLGGTLFGDSSSEPVAQEVVREIEAMGGSAVASTASVATAEGTGLIAQLALDTYGRIDVLINNAGIVRTAPWELWTQEDIRSLFDVHVLGPAMLTQAVYPAMREHQYGRIVFISSAAGIWGLPNQLGYSIAKAAVLGMMNDIALEAEPHGVLANMVLPIAITRLADLSDAATPAARAASTIQAAPANRDRISLDEIDPRRMDPENVVPMVVYLASEECTFTKRAYSAAASRYARVILAPTAGWYGPEDRPATAEELVDQLDTIDDASRFTEPASCHDELRIIFQGMPTAT